MAISNPKLITAKSSLRRSGFDRSGALGFTLVEIVLVVALIGVLAAMSVVSFADWSQKNTFEKDVAQVLAAFSEARSLSRARQDCVVVTISNAAHALVLTTHQPEAFTNSCAGPFTVVKETLPAYSFSSGTTLSEFSTGGFELTYNIHGGLVSTDAVTAKVTSDKGAVRQLTIFPAIGQVRAGN